MRILVVTALAAVAMVGVTLTRVTPAVAQEANPAMPEKCGERIALVFDLSVSITDSQLLAMKEAGNQVVRELTGTPSEIGVYTFGTFAPAYNTATSTAPAGNVAFPGRPVPDADAARQIEDHINGMSAPVAPVGQISAGYTNWQQALLQTLRAHGQPPYDAVLLITDGMPTAYDGPLTGNTVVPGNINPPATPAVRDAAFAAADQVKAQGTRVLAVNVSDDVAVPLEYLHGIASPDAVYSTSFANLGATIAGLATEYCDGTLNIVKEIQATDGTRSAGAGWTFTGAAVAPATMAPGSGVTNAGGVANLGAISATTNVTVAETAKSGYRLVPQGGRNATCENRNGSPLAVTDKAGGAFSVPVATNDIVTCTVVNEVTPATLTLIMDVRNKPGSGTATPDNWTLHATASTVTGTTTIAGLGSGTTHVVPIGTYTMSESGGLPGYTPGAAWSCTGNGTAMPAGDRVTLAAGEHVTCVLTVTEDPVVHLEQNKTVNSTTAVHGDTLTYTMTVRNVGTGDAADFTATDVLPAGLDYVSAAASTGSYDDGTGVWTIPSLSNVAPGNVATLVVTATVSADPAPGDTQTIMNRFQVTPPTGGTVTAVGNPCGDNAAQSCAETVVHGPDPDYALALSKTVDQAVASDGDPVTYTITVENIGNMAAGAFTVTDTLPDGVAFASYDAPVGTVATSGQSVTWTVPALPVVTSAGHLITLTITVTVNPGHEFEDTTQTNPARISTLPSSFGPPEVAPSNQCAPSDAHAACASFDIPGVVRLTQDKTVAPTGPVAAGDLLTYTMTLTNSGTADLASALAHDALPENTTFVSADTNGAGSFDESTGLWDIGSIPIGHTVTLTVVARVEAAAEASTLVSPFQYLEPAGGGVLVTVRSQCADAAAASCAETVVPGVPRLTQDKVVDIARAAAGDTLTYTVTVANHGTGPATGVTATDIAPSRVAIVSSTTADGTFDETTGVWHIGTIDPGAVAALTVSVQVDASAVNSTVANRMVVPKPANGPAVLVNNPCPDEHAASCAPTEVPGTPQLILDKTVDKSVAAVGDTLTYAITVTNHGDGDGSGVLVRDLMPDGVALVSAEANEHGWFNTDGDIWVIPLLRPQATATLTLRARVAPGTAGQTISNQVQVTAPVGSAPSTIENPCEMNAARSCAQTEVRSSLPMTGADLGYLPIIAMLLALAGVGAVASGTRLLPRRR